MGNGKWGNGKWEMGNGKWGNGKWEMGNGEMGNLHIFVKLFKDIKINIFIEQMSIKMTKKYLVC